LLMIMGEALRMSCTPCKPAAFARAGSTAIRDAMLASWQLSEIYGINTSTSCLLLGACLDDQP
jgi:hypothetical protein